ncbi:hypothetical protein [Xanthobacter sp. YC-JY1]|uniref:hypothetical protein n=1 Tax=Xanthobacter sp. YC-JY1 TaxID=2419844 RepID=UPI001F47D8EE|nr:hypothetical protein [Xanthobacter sp. YC-JY1]UJX46646.1 hypothetical protein D7006_19350 [Xanthobacter sp. YC-JY1]
MKRFAAGVYEGVMRIRASRPGFDAEDMSLGNEQIVFDSAWPEILSVLDADWQLTGTPSVETWVADGGVTYTRRCRTVTFATLPWEPICIGWARGVDTSGYVAYTQTPSCSYTDHCTFTVGSASVDSAYIIFANPLTQADSREADNGGSYNLLAGVHPTRGPGLFVPRRGADVLTCPDRDLRLTIERPPFQIAEAGAVWRASGAVTVNLTGSYPDFPPVIIMASEDRGSAPSVAAGPTVRWVNASTIQIEITSSNAQAIQYIIPAYDPTYVHGPDAVSTPRVLMDQAVGLAISQRNVDVRFASESQLLFRATRPMLNVAERKAVNNAGVAAISKTALTTNPVGPPIAFFGAYRLGRWWSAAGGIDMQNAALGAPSSLPSPGAINYEMFATINQEKKLRAAWVAGNSTPNLRVAVVDHSATLLDDSDLYSGPALEAESVYDDFSGATDGSAPPGWTRRFQAASGMAVVTNAVASALAGKAIRVTGGFGTPAASTYAEITFDAPGSAVTDCDILAGVRMVNGPIVFPMEIMFRRSASATHQAAGIVCDVSGGVASGQRMWFGPAYDAASGATDFAWAYDTWYWLRLNVKGGARRLKIWPRGSAEPSFWGLAFVGPGSASGYVGLTQWGSTSTPYAYLDFFSVCTTGRPAWGPLT